MIQFPEITFEVIFDVTLANLYHLDFPGIKQLRNKSGSIGNEIKYNNLSLPIYLNITC